MIQEDVEERHASATAGNHSGEHCGLYSSEPSPGHYRNIVPVAPRTCRPQSQSFYNGLTYRRDLAASMGSDHHLMRTIIAATAGSALSGLAGACASEPTAPG
jgi:hypothetical protein